MDKHSGKRLCDVPEKDLFVGMEVISAKGRPGKISALFFPPADRYLSIDFIWDNGTQSIGAFHSLLEKVTVK